MLCKVTALGMHPCVPESVSDGEPLPGRVEVSFSKAVLVTEGNFQ